MLFKQTLIAIAIFSSFAFVGCGGEDSTNKDTTPAEVSIQENVTIKEPDSGEQSHSVKVSLNKKALKNGSVDYKLTPSSALAGTEYIAQSGTLLILEGERDFAIDVVVRGDDLDEDDEVFHIQLSNPVNVTIANSAAVFTLEDTDETPAISFEFNKGYITEGTADYSITLNLTNGSERDISIPFELTGLATINQDYHLLTESPIVLDSGQTSVNINFDILADAIPEGGESIIISLRPPLNAEVDEENNTAYLIIPGDLAITDTGVTTYFNGDYDNNGAPIFSEYSTNANYPMQDAEFGLDSSADNNSNGESGFVYSKIDSSGNALHHDTQSYESDNINGYRCVRDVNSGLTWEVKSTTLHELPQLSGKALKDHIADEVDKFKDEDNVEPFKYTNAQANWQTNEYTYYWYNKTETSNGGIEGATGELLPNIKYPINSMCAYPNENMSNYSSDNKFCDTSVYAEYANSMSMCGFNDWRIPNVEELRSIHNYNVSDSKVDTINYFGDESTGNYFTSSPTVENSGSVWCVNSESGEAKLCNKQQPNHIRLVRGGQ